MPLFPVPCAHNLWILQGDFQQPFLPWGRRRNENWLVEAKMSEHSELQSEARAYACACGLVWLLLGETEVSVQDASEWNGGAGQKMTPQLGWDSRTTPEPRISKSQNSIPIGRNNTHSGSPDDAFHYPQIWSSAPTPKCTCGLLIKEPPPFSINLLLKIPPHEIYSSCGSLEREEVIPFCTH